MLRRQRGKKRKRGKEYVDDPNLFASFLCAQIFFRPESKEQRRNALTLFFS
jgi:hypothetical protein